MQNFALIAATKIRREPLWQKCEKATLHEEKAFFFIFIFSLLKQLAQHAKSHCLDRRERSRVGNQARQGAMTSIAHVRPASWLIW